MRKMLRKRLRKMLEPFDDSTWSLSGGTFGQLKDASVAIQYFRVFPSCVYLRTLANSSEFSVLDVGAEVCLCGIDEGCDRMLCSSGGLG
jgi:hypothetical protein